jgi:hypothetical protein
VKALKRAGCKIGRDNWQSWRGMIDRAFAGNHEEAAKAALQIQATERWPDQVEALKETKKPEVKDEASIASSLHRFVVGIVGGDVFVKAHDLLAAAKLYGPDEVRRLAEHAAEIGSLSKELARNWFHGRKSQYGGWDFYAPKKKLETPKTADEVMAEIEQVPV